MSNRDERDDFWDIEKLIPSRAGKRMSPFATRPETVAYDVPGDVSSEREAEASSEADSCSSRVRSAEERRLTVQPASRTEGESHTYYPENMGLIKKVTVKRLIDKYDFYESFRRSALLYFDCPASKCDFAQFYSYMPQYAHLTPSQRSYYLYWRSELRAGKYIKTDYSYLYLFVYEIINLPDKIPPREGIELLCRIWREYRKALPRIDLYFAIWIEDYCLVHELPCPDKYIGDFLYDCIGTAPIKEFYLADINDAGLGGVDKLLAYLSDYDWKRGRYASGEGGVAGSTLKSEDYRSHMMRAMYLVLVDLWNGRLLTDGARETVSRDAFPNTLCTHSVKSRIEVEYISLSGSDDVRRAIGAAVRYTENKLRALLGVKSRLAVKDLPIEYRAIIDRYFGKYMEAEAKRQREASRPAYERLYEAPTGSLSLEGAREIEAMSWQTTARLVEAEDEIVYAPGITPRQADCEKLSLVETDTEKVGENTAAYVSKTEQNIAQTVAETVAETPSFGAPGAIAECSASDRSAGAESTSDSPLNNEELCFLEALISGNLIATATPTETVVERINEIFLDRIGDIIIEMNDVPEIIEDYREDIEEWICRIRK